MGLFGKKKASSAPFPQQETVEEEIVTEEETEAEENESAEEAAPELSPEERFKQDCANISKCLRVLFPQQMLIGFYYAELQTGGYIDDFCCYATDGRLIERQDIPKLCGMSLPDMVSREEKLEQAFFKLHESAPAASGKPFNAVSMMMLNDGQVKMDITSGELTEGEEDIRYANWRKKIDMANPRYLPPRIDEEKMKQIQERTNPAYNELGTEFYSFLPGEDFKVAYFYAENGENGVFYFHRLVTNDGEIIDGDELFDRYDMDKEEAANNRVTIVKLIMDIRQVFVDFGEKPFSSITLSVTGKGEFTSNLGFGPTDAAGEQERLELWKKKYNGK
jgi:hypothetical protein